MGMSSVGNVGDILSGLINYGVQDYLGSQEQGNLMTAADSYKAAQYQPVDFTQAQHDTVKGNLQNLPYINTLDAQANKGLTKDWLARANSLIPGYSGAMQAYGSAASNLLSGRLPYSDVLDTISGQGQASNALGIAGTSTPATLKDLGLSQLSGIQQGGGMLQQMVAIAGQIAPTSSYLTPGNMMLNPSQTIPWDMEQAQDTYDSQQNAYNIGTQKAYALANAQNLPLTMMSNASTQAMQAYAGSGGATVQPAPPAQPASQSPSQYGGNGPMGGYGGWG